MQKNSVTMKKKIINWILQKIHLSLQEEILWKLKFSDKLKKNHYVIPEEKEITVVIDYPDFTKITKLIPELNKSIVYLHGDHIKESREMDLQTGLLGLI